MWITRENLMNERGFTLLELFLVVAILGIIVTSIVTFFTKSHDTAIRASQSQHVLASKQWALYQIMLDLRSASRCTVGSYILNGGFESSEDKKGPDFWADKATGVGVYKYFETQSSQTVRGGFCSVVMRLNTGNEIYLESEDFFSLTPDMAYMLSGWVRCANLSVRAGISLVDESYATVVSTTAQSTDWMQLTCRYPSSNNYTSGMVSNNRVKCRLSVIFDNGAGPYGPIYFDNISLTPLESVMVSLESTANVNHTVSDVTSPFDPVGFRFYRWENEVLRLYRYRIGSQGSANQYLIREVYNVDSDIWEKGNIHSIAKGVEELQFIYDDQGLLPTEGKETPLEVNLLIRSKNDRIRDVYKESDKILIYPLSP
ncbi:MAG: prepilin-type N-terminal cleavage/methylation domain-containing protein [Elusimicrobia bacterium]|nr:prepilin-type N-terminal cleavage/methylation domain-containing protein [Elusimicrobiota bacterium]